MYKIISTSAKFECQSQINALESDGFVLVHFSVAMSNYRERDYTALMHKPDAAPHMTTEQYLAARTPLERLADKADEVLRDEARQHGCGQ